MRRTGAAARAAGYAAEMGAAASLTYAEYLAVERESEVRHEFLAGEAWAMAGGTPRHSAIKANLLIALGAALRGTPCRVYDSDLKLRVVATGLASYADLAVVCGPIERHPEDPHAVTNPTAVFEVLSPSTERWDRGGKFEHFGAMPSLGHYVLVTPDRPQFEVFTRTAPGVWELRRFGAGSEAVLAALGMALAVDAAYEALPDEAERA